jgi:molecular chaperone GrpE
MSRKTDYNNEAEAAAHAAADAAQAAVDAAEDAAAIDEVLEDLDAVEAQLVEELSDLDRALAEADELRDRYARLQADWDNFRKRTNTERQQERSRAAQHLIERLLPVVDDLERAIEHSDTANEASLKAGIAAVYAKLSEVLAKEGLQAIDPAGEAFDANLHQAVGKAEDPNVPDETVSQVYQKGYQIADRVLRPAMVVVSSGGPKREE